MRTLLIISLVASVSIACSNAAAAPAAAQDARVADTTVHVSPATHWRIDKDLRREVVGYYPIEDTPGLELSSTTGHLYAKLFDRATTELKRIDEYTFVAPDQRMSMSFNREDQTMTVTYTVDPLAAVPVQTTLMLALR
ncbi:MAG: hypothetical protein V4582_05175 [Pseudomonadota bacterium]